MPTRVVWDDDEQQIADLEKAVRRLQARLATTTVHGTHDEFTVAATPETTFQLTYIPVDGTCAMFNDKDEQEEDTDYTVDYDTGLVTFDTALTTGDRINFRYLITDWLVARSLPAEGDDPTTISSTGNSYGARTSADTGTFTPTADALIIVPVTFGTTNGATITATDTLGGLTWTEVDTGYSPPGGGIKTSIFWAIAPSSPTAGKVTLTSSWSSTYFTIGDVIQVTSGFTPGSPIAQSAHNYTDGSGGSGTTTLTATLGSTPSGLVIALLAQSYDNTSPVPPGDDTDFTHLAWIQGVNSFDRDLDTSFAFGEQSSTWTGLNLNSFGFWYYQGLIVEIQ